MTNETNQERPIAYMPAEAARLLSVSRATLYARIKDGTIPSVKIGGRRLIRREVLEQLLQGDDPVVSRGQPEPLADPPDPERVARYIARCVRRAHRVGQVRSSVGSLRRAVAARDRPVFAEALGIALDCRWVSKVGTKYEPGPSVPAEDAE